MSEPRWVKGMRGEPRVRIPEPKKKGLECPVCGCRTVNRDVSPADGYYVEWCSSGVLRFRDEETDEVEEFDCPYFDGGFDEDFLRRKRRRLFEVSKKLWGD